MNEAMNPITRAEELGFVWDDFYQEYVTEQNGRKFYIVQHEISGYYALTEQVAEYECNTLVMHPNYEVIHGAAEYHLRIRE